MYKFILLIFLFFGFGLQCFSQDNIEYLEKQLDDNYGVDKLIILNQLSQQYQEVNIRKAVKYGKQAVNIADNLFPDDSSQAGNDQYNLKVDANNLLGEAQFIKENYYDAQQCFQASYGYALNSNYLKGIEKAEAYLALIDSIGIKSNIFKESLSDIKLGKAINKGSQDLALSSTLKAAETYEKNGSYEKAIKNYNKAINYLKDKGDEEQIAELYRKIAENYNNLGNFPKSLEYYKLAIGEKEKLGDTSGLQASREGINNLQVQIDDFIESNDNPVDSAEMIVELQTREDYKNMAMELEANKDYEKSIEYYKLYLELNDKIIEDEKEQQLALLDKSHQISKNLQEIQLLTQDKEIQELELQKQESEIDQQNKFRRNLIVGIILLLALAGAFYILYISKRRDHKRLNVAHLQLKSTQEKLINAEKKIKTLLGQQLSSEVAHALLSEDSDLKIQRKLACVMFLDIRGFTTFAEQRKPEEIIKFQNDVFGFMIDSVYKHHGIINQFLGDGFMATFGAPVSTGNDSQNAVDASIEIVKLLKEKCESGDIPKTKVGIGMHTGYIVTGNVGTAERKQFSITGNTVILASRIEQLNKQFNSEILVSKDVIENMDQNDLQMENLGPVNLKGRADPIEIFRLS